MIPFIQCLFCNLPIYLSSNNNISALSVRNALCNSCNADFTIEFYKFLKDTHINEYDRLLTAQEIQDVVSIEIIQFYINNIFVKFNLYSNQILIFIEDNNCHNLIHAFPLNLNLLLRPLPDLKNKILKLIPLL